MDMIPKWNSLHSFLDEVFMDLRRPYWAQWSRNHWYFLRYVHLDHTFIRGSCYFPLNHCYSHLKFKDNYLQLGTDFCFQVFKWTFLTEGACVCSLHACFFSTCTNSDRRSRKILSSDYQRRQCSQVERTYLSNWANDELDTISWFRGYDFVANWLVMCTM